MKALNTVSEDQVLVITYRTRGKPGLLWHKLANCCSPSSKEGRVKIKCLPPTKAGFICKGSVGNKIPSLAWQPGKCVQPPGQGRWQELPAEGPGSGQGQREREREREREHLNSGEHKWTLLPRAKESFLSESFCDSLQLVHGDLSTPAVLAAVFPSLPTLNLKNYSWKTQN
jgi:hypothetical protein